MDKGLGVIEIGNSIKGFINFIGKLYPTNGTKSAEVSCLSDEIQIIKRVGAKANDKITVPYDTTIPTTFNSDYNTYLLTIFSLSFNIVIWISLSCTITNIELGGNDSYNNVVIFNGINSLTENYDIPFTIKSTSYGGNKEIKIPYGMKFVIVKYQRKIVFVGNQCLLEQ
jgi:hypothetical protein